MGRLFDAVASLIGIRHEVNFEAQAAMELEALAAGSIDLDEDDSYSFSLLLSEPSPVIITLRRVLSDICEDHGAGVSRSRISARFHRAVATMVRRVCERARSQTGLEIVGLTGGVFQNVLLLRLTVAQLEESGFEVLTHHIVPANDAGIALGQAFVGCSRTVNKNG
jgi:hydrogenase maturation protein HypF